MSDTDLKADAAKVEALAHNVWLKWEPYACLLAGLVLGFLAAHFFHL